MKQNILQKLGVAKPFLSKKNIYTLNCKFTYDDRKGEMLYI